MTRSRIAWDKPLGGVNDPPRDPRLPVVSLADILRRDAARKRTLRQELRRRLVDVTTADAIATAVRDRRAFLPALRGLRRHR